MPRMASLISIVTISIIVISIRPLDASVRGSNRGFKTNVELDRDDNSGDNVMVNSMPSYVKNNAHETAALLSSVGILTPQLQTNHRNNNAYALFSKESDTAIADDAQQSNTVGIQQQQFSHCSCIGNAGAAMTPSLDWKHL